jgi:excisionase family DNA binding protein
MRIALRACWVISKPICDPLSGSQRRIAVREGKLLLDVSEVAEILGVGRSHVYRYILRGDLRSLKLGRRRKVSVEAIHEFVEKLQREQACS